MERVFEGLSMGSKMQTRYNVSYNNSINKLEQPNTKNMFQLQNCSTDVFILKTTPSGELQDLKYHSLHYSANKRLHLFGPMSVDARSNCHIKRSRSKLKSSGRATKVKRKGHMVNHCLYPTENSLQFKTSSL